jgi:hypothetical protein
VQETKDPKTLAEQAKPLAEHGGERKSEEIQPDNINLKVVGGTSASHLTACRMRFDRESKHKTNSRWGIIILL